jgi:hypothetical protein
MQEANCKTNASVRTVLEDANNLLGDAHCMVNQIGSFLKGPPPDSDRGCCPEPPYAFGAELTKHTESLSVLCKKLSEITMILGI